MYGDWVPTPHEKPRYRHIADELRRRIASGAIPPGALISSEPALMREFGVARGTVREAIALLRNEGTVVTEHGRGTLARPTFPVRRLGPDRYQAHSTKTDGRDRSSRADTERGTPASGETIDAEYREVAATPELAALFEIQDGTTLLELRLLVRTHGIPQQLTTSYYPLELVAGTAVADQDHQSSADEHVTQLRALGLTVTQIRETVRARMPTKAEAQGLALPNGTPVLSITRRTYVEDKIVEVANQVVLPADRFELEYDIPLHQPAGTTIA
jgi:GntR family transcriptional regulator